ncbi:IQ domain-containing protein H-like [Vespula squamosa]|uniref:IQ domain-containing protein H-like n=1 Tax=Vespula squamosa TaxID=30214 RepID=A0ABD2B7F3_VESSQ
MVRINEDDLNLACIKEKVDVKRNCDCCGRLICHSCDTVCVDKTKKNDTKCSNRKYSEESTCRSSLTNYNWPRGKQCVRSIAKNCKRPTIECTRIKKCIRNHVAEANGPSGKRCVRSIAKNCKKPAIECTRIKKCIRDMAECSKGKQCVRSIAKNYSKSMIECIRNKKCIKDHVAEAGVSQNDEKIKSCNDVRYDKCNASSPSSNSTSNDVCKNISSKEIKMNDEDICPDKNLCKQFGCLELDDPNVCVRIPSIIKHIEQCKENFLEIIKASLINIGKSDDPEKIISSTLRSARANEVEDSLKEKKWKSCECEQSSSSHNELKFAKNLCRDDFLSAAWREFKKYRKSLKPRCVVDNAAFCIKDNDRYKPEVCGPCGIDNVVPCIKDNNRYKPEVCGPCNVNNAMPCMRNNDRYKPEVCGPCGIDNVVPCIKNNNRYKPEVCGPCGIDNVVPCIKNNNRCKTEVCGPCGIDYVVPCIKNNNRCKTEVCGPCGIDYVVPCIKNNDRYKPEVCGPCGIDNVVPCIKNNNRYKPEVCGPCGIDNVVPCIKDNDRYKPEVCGPCGIDNVVPCIEENDMYKPEVCGPCGVNNAVPCIELTSRGYKNDEISEFVKLIDLKLREELTKNLRKKLCCDDSVELKNSYYCVATLCPCMTKNYSMKGPLILGPFNFGPQDEENDVCQKESDKSEEICSSLDTLESFHYSNCIVNSDDSMKSSSVSSTSTISSELVECNRAEPTICYNFPPKCRRREPVVLDHNCNYVSSPDRRAEEHLEKSYSKKSEEVAKWGKCRNMFNSESLKRGKKMEICEEMGLDMEQLEKQSKKIVCKRENGDEEEYLLTHVCGLDKPCASKLRVCKREEDVCKNICSKPSHICRVGFDGACITGDDFDNLERFENIGSYAFAKLCRKLFKWVHCISKNWHEIRSHPYIVVHLPSLSYPDQLKCRARKTFDLLQNIQVGRIGWLDDSNVQVLYVFPTPQSEELMTILKNLIVSVRPDIDISKRLWLLRPEPKCLLKNCVSGSANLFFSSDVYRRVRYLTAGRHAFILPGVIDQKNVFIACELQIPMMGLPLQFQKRLLKKSYIMQLLDINKVQHPPFIHIHSFGQLCRGLAVMVIEYSMYKTWFVKIDNGFNGYQTAIVCFKKGILGDAIKNIKRTTAINEDYLCKLLAEALPLQMQIQKMIYKSQKEFFQDLEMFGGIVQACPNNYYDVLSIGVFIEHDLAKPIVTTAAEVIHFGRNIRNDMAYFLPQNKILQDELDELVEKIGIILRNEHVVGYFGIDVVTFHDEFDDKQFWVVDIDPYYTNLIAFSDWIKFCIGPRKDDTYSYFPQNTTNESKVENITQLLIETNRHVICCAKLFGTGLSKYCGSTLINLCKQNQIYYDNKEKIGCMIYPTDSHNRAISIISINSTRLMTMKKFIEALKVINQLSLRININETFADTIDICRNLRSMQQNQN